MRKVLSVAMMAAMLSFVGMTKDAGATVTISLEWAACATAALCAGSVLGSNTITVNPGGGQTLRLDIYMQTTVAAPIGIESHAFSLQFDTNLENELNLGPMANTEWSGTDTDPSGGTSIYGTFTAGLTSLESSGASLGRINNYESASLGLNLPATGVAYSYLVGTVTFTATAPARYLVGAAFFTVNGAVSDGADVFSGYFAIGDKIIIGDGLGTIIPTTDINWGTATINVVPEPGTVSLLGLGLVGLILAGRRSRRS